MSRRNIGYIAVVILLILPAVHIAYNHFASNKVPKRPEGYAGSQAERLESWGEMKRLPLTDSNISAFVENTLAKEDLKPPAGCGAVQSDKLTPEQKSDIRLALEGFLTAYRGKDPVPVFEYLTGARGNTRFPDEVKQRMVAVAQKTDPSLKLLSDKDVFCFVWNMGSKGIDWEALLDKSGKIGYWETDKQLTKEQNIQMVIEEPKLFSNTSSMPHMFTVSQDLFELLQKGKKVLFSDVFFVSELVPTKDSDVCAVGVRFWWNETNHKWTPLSLILVTPQVRQDLQIPF